MVDVARGRPHGSFTQHRRLTRLRQLLTREPRGLSLYELADALEVTPRTLRRYLKELQQTNEVESLCPRSGGALLWRLRPPYGARQVALRRRQAFGLLAARRVFEPLRGSGLFEEIDLALESLLALARRPGRDPDARLGESRLEERFLYLPSASKDYSGKAEELEHLFQAVADLRPLRCSYRTAGGASEERITIHPYALVLHRDSIYCVGYHAGRGEVRTFLLDGMRETECSLTERFTLPSDFDLDQYFQGEFGIWQSSQRNRVVIDFDSRAAPSLRLRRVHPTQKLAGVAGGGLRLTMMVGDLSRVVSWVLQWGPQARVVEPPELVERVRAELKAALAQYGAAGERPARR